MATFSQGFLSGLGKPAMTQSLFNLGTAIGSVPGQLKAREEEKKTLDLFNQISQISGEGVQSAQEGEVVKLRGTIEKLEQARDKAPTLEQKELIQKQIDNLNSRLPGAKVTKISNQLNRAIELDTLLKESDSQGLTDLQVKELKDEKNNLLTNSEIIKGYTSYKINQTTLKNAQDAKEFETWKDSNLTGLRQGIRDDDTDVVDTIIKDAYDKGYGSEVSLIAERMYKNRETSKSIAELNEQKRVPPQVETLRKLVNSIEKEVGPKTKQIINDLFKQYETNAESGWNEENQTWTTNARIKDKELFKQISNYVNAAIMQAEELDEKEKRAEKDALRRIETDLQIKLEIPAGEDIIKEARSILNNFYDEKELKEMIERDKNPNADKTEGYTAILQKEIDRLHEAQQDRYRAQLDIITAKLNNEETPTTEGGSGEQTIFDVVNKALISENIPESARKNRKTVYEFLKAEGIINERHTAEDIEKFENELYKKKEDENSSFFGDFSFRPRTFLRAL